DWPRDYRTVHAMRALVAGRGHLAAQAAQFFPHVLGRLVLEAGEPEQVAEHAQDLPSGPRLANRRSGAWAALPHAFEVDVCARSLGESADGQQDVGDLPELLACERRDGD